MLLSIINSRYGRIAIVVVIALFAISYLLSSGESVEQGSWVHLDGDSGTLFYVMEEKSPYGINEIREDPDGYQRICHLLEFTPHAVTNSDGESLFEPKLVADAEWELCRLLSLTNEPSFATGVVLADLVAEASAQ